MIYRSFEVKYKRAMSKKAANKKANKIAKDFDGYRLYKCTCITKKNKSTCFIYIAIYY